MQPPPRKVKHSVALKNHHSEQLSKLQANHQQECDLLEDISDSCNNIFKVPTVHALIVGHDEDTTLVWKDGGGVVPYMLLKSVEERGTYSRQRAVLEKDYAQGLMKLVTQLLKKDYTVKPELDSEDGKDYKTAVTVWKTILEETEKVAKARLQASEIFMEKIAEPIKPLKSSKVQCLKKIIPQLQTIQAEVSQSILEMTKSHKVYTVDETMAHDARLKANDAEDRLKRKSTGLFQSLTSLQRNCAKLNSRKDSCEVKSTLSRNDYCLNLAAGNAHQIRYYSTDLPELMKILDGEVFERIQECFSVLGDKSREVVNVERTCCDNICELSGKISREYDLQCFLHGNPVFTDLVQYQFEPCHNDPCNIVSQDHNAGPQVEKEARKWATKIAKESKILRDVNKLIVSLQNHSSGDRSPETVAESAAREDIEQKIEEARQTIRKSETAKLKAEARIEALRVAGVNVEEWLESAQVDTLQLEEGVMCRTPSQLSLRTESSGGHSEDQEPTYHHYDDDDDEFIDDTFETSKDSSFMNSTMRKKYPILCKALYDFQASNSDELSLIKDQNVELIGDGDGDGWVRAKGPEGLIGYIPESYVNVQGEVNVETYNDYNQGTYNDAGYSDQQSNSEASEIQLGPISDSSEFDMQSPPMSANGIKQEVTSYSSGDIEVQQATKAMSPDKFTLPVGDSMWAKALYDYEASTTDELSFNEGTLIKILRKDQNGVDDGFWEGEINGKVGVFPSLVVEEISPDAAQQDMLTPVCSGPPDFIPPPPVTVTLATPEDDEYIDSISDELATTPQASATEQTKQITNGTGVQELDSTQNKNTQYTKRVRFCNSHNHQRINYVQNYRTDYNYYYGDDDDFDDEDGEESVV